VKTPKRRRTSDPGLRTFAIVLKSGSEKASDLRVVAPTGFEPGLWAARKLPVELEQHWREWLGSLRIDLLRDADFVLCATVNSDRPDILDAENEALTRRVNHLFYGMLLQGVPAYRKKGFSLGGAAYRNTVDVRQFSELRDPEPSLGMPAFCVSAAVLTQAAVLARELERIDHANGEWTRFRRGLQALFDGTRALSGGNRLHQFVRALEGLVKPEISRTKRQFVHRVQTFTRPGQDTQLALEQIFDIRSHVEHLHSPLDALAGSNEERIELANRRTRQADTLARFAFARILGSGPLLEVFRTDRSIDDFWARPDHERRAAWGVPLELVHIA